MIFEPKRDIKPIISLVGRVNGLREKIITLACIGRSIRPIKDLIKEYRDKNLDREKFCTSVRKPAPKDSRLIGIYL